MRYIFRRLGFYLIALFVSLTLNFFLPRLMPGDPATVIFGRFKGRVAPETLEALKITFGFTEGPIIEQYITYLGHAVRGDFGISVSHFPQPVNKVIARGMLWTLLLSGIATIIAFLLGSILGVISAWKRGTWLDGALPPLLTFINSFPYFWLAMVALLVFSVLLNWLPIGQAYNNQLDPGWNLAYIGSVFEHLILPAATIVLVSVGGWMLSMRNTMISILAEDYISMAEAKGLSERRIMFWYAARNALLPNITSFGIALGFVVSGALLTEVVFSYPGLGFLLFDSVSSLDYPLLQGLFLIITLAVLGANLIVDFLYVRLDPRVRAN